MTVSDTRQEAAVSRKSYARVSVNHIINIPAEKMDPQEKCLNWFVEEYRLVNRNGKLWLMLTTECYKLWVILMADGSFCFFYSLCRSRQRRSLIGRISSGQKFLRCRQKRLLIERWACGQRLSSLKGGLQRTPRDTSGPVSNVSLIREEDKDKHQQDGGERKEIMMGKKRTSCSF